MYWTKRLFTLITLLAAFSGAVRAGEGTISGYVAGEVRLFPDEPLRPEQFGTAQPSLIVAPEFRFRLKSRNDQFSFAPFVRLEGVDRHRFHFDIREAYWLHRGDGWDLTAGANRVFWGVTESRHLVDVINQTDFVEDIDEEDKLGQPMVNFNFQQDWGALSVFLLPGFRERTFASAEGRPGFPLPVDTDNAVYESSAGRKHVDFALRYSHFFGDWDLGLSYFRGTGREPRLVVAPGGQRLIPHYDLISQGGLELQYTKDAWLFKVESILREGQGETFGALVGGFEYTLYQVVAGRADLGLLFEYQYDGRDAEAPFTLSNDDLFLGARLAWNDSQNTAVLAGAIIDRQNGSTLISIEAERRIGNQFRVEFEGRFFVNAAVADPLYLFRNDSFLTMRFSRFF